MLKYCDNKGFSLIEILVTLVIIAILASISIPGYIGIREMARVHAVIRASSSATAEISFWLQASNSAEGARNVDTNVDGIVNGSDLTNGELKIAGVASTYVLGKAAERSPWFPESLLWTNDSSLPNGKVTLIQQSITSIRMVAKDRTGNIIFEKIISAD